jgi:L-2-amino-thiazoline-4-carboxylic acid hydrolase-like protein
MTEAGNTSVATAVFTFLEPSFARIAETLAGDDDAVLSGARRRFEEIEPTLAYRDEPGDPMALALFSCASCLALYLQVRERGVDAHQLGQAIHEEFAKLDLPPDGLSKRMIAAAARSQESPRVGEFVFEVAGSAGDNKWEMNIRSCAICHLFSKFDAMDLVPYMCALDDLFSDAAGQGLRRTGTIALGATHCDFRYDADGEPLRLVDQFPARIQLRASPT